MVIALFWNGKSMGQKSLLVSFHIENGQQRAPKISLQDRLQARVCSIHSWASHELWCSLILFFQFHWKRRDYIRVVSMNFHELRVWPQFPIFMGIKTRIDDSLWKTSTDKTKWWKPWELDKLKSHLPPPFSSHSFLWSDFVWPWCPGLALWSHKHNEVISTEMKNPAFTNK